MAGPTLIVFMKAEQRSLFAESVQVHGYTKKDGTHVDAHVSTRHVAPETVKPKHHAEQPSLFDNQPEGEVEAPQVEAAPEVAVPEVTAPEPEPQAAATSDPDSEFEAAEDRQDIADAMAGGPHSDEAKAALERHVAKHAPAPGPAPAPPALLDDLDPSSPNYRYRDTGYVAGSRKEMAASMIRRMARGKERVRVTDVDWEAIEQNPREAKELIVKENLFGAVDWTDLRDAGMEPGAGFLASKVYSAVAAKPAEDTPEGRRDYSLAITTLRDRVEACRSVEEMTACIAEIRDERDGAILNERESALYNTAMDQMKEAQGRVRAIEIGEKEVDGRLTAAQRDFYLARTDVEKAERRGKPAPADKVKLRDKLLGEFQTLAEEKKVYRTANGMDHIAHRTETPGGYTSRLEYPYRAEVDQLYAVLRTIKNVAVTRNKAENPLTRAWNSLGSSFHAVIDYRSGTKGSEAFAKHVATVKAGRVADWSWAEKKGEPRGATKRSTSFQLKVADHVERTGGREIDVGSTEALKSTFGLREVQSGNWVLDDPNAAKFHVERCAGAFADLADILGVEDAKVSFNGRLAMAFGARGKGKALAHYEPVERVINITKMAGAGSLAHEWFHCIDNLVGEAVSGVPSGSEDFATVSPASVDHAELSAAFAAVTRAMTQGPHRNVETVHYTEAEERWAGNNMAVSYGGSVRNAIKEAAGPAAAADAVDALFERGAFGAKDKHKAKKTRDTWKKIAVIHHGANPDRKVEYETGPGMSSFMLDAVTLDKGDPGKYWSATHELGARAFSAFVEDKLNAAGRSNTYLVSDANNAVYAATGERPYPEKGERERINAAMEHLFSLIVQEDVLAKAAAVLEAGLA